MTASWRVGTYLGGAFIAVLALLIGLFALEVNPFTSALVLLGAMALLLFAVSKLFVQVNGFKNEMCRNKIKESSYGG